MVFWSGIELQRDKVINLYIITVVKYSKSVTFAVRYFAVVAKGNGL